MRTQLLAAVTVLLILSGCTGLQGKVNGRIEESLSRADRLVKDVGQIESSGKTDTSIVHENGIWIGKNIIKREEPPLPTIFYEQATFERTVQSISEMAERITLRSGIPVKVAPEVLGAYQTGGTAGAQGQPSESLSGGSAAPVGSRAPGGSSTTINPAAAQANQPVRIVYSGGNFKGLLDTVSARFGIFWRYVDGAIQFFNTDTRTFQIHAIPGDSALNATVVSGSVSGGSGASDGGAATAAGINANNTQNTAVRSTLSVYSSIERAVAAMLSPFGKVTASPATGSITVTDTPDTIERVAKLIERENKSLAQQVMINVTVLAVSVEQSDSYGINWNLLYSDLSRRYGITNTFASDTGSTALSASILSTSSSRFAGTSLIIEALSKQGNVRRETTASVVTLNNQPVPVQVAKQTTYLRSSQTTLTPNVGSTTTLTPGQVTSGFNMTILPHILQNGTVMLQFSADISALVGIRRAGGATNFIETPELDTRNFLQRVAMKSNETLIISGFEQTDDNIDRQGVGTPRNVLLGGGHKTQGNKEIIVILITPVTMSSS